MYFKMLFNILFFKTLKIYNTCTYVLDNQGNPFSVCSKNDKNFVDSMKNQYRF